MPPIHNIIMYLMVRVREENAKYNFGFDDADKNCITTSDKRHRERESRKWIGNLIRFWKFFDNVVKTGDDISYLYIHYVYHTFSVKFNWLKFPTYVLKGKYMWKTAASKIKKKIFPSIALSGAGRTPYFSTLMHCIKSHKIHNNKRMH